MSLKYEPSSEPLRISAKYLFLYWERRFVVGAKGANIRRAREVAGVWNVTVEEGRVVLPNLQTVTFTPYALNPEP